MRVDLSSPIQSLIPSLDAAALEVLARTRSALSAMQIMRAANRGSRAGLTLVRSGLVIAVDANTGCLHRLNRDHVLAPSVETAVAARTEVFARLQRALEATFPTPVHASVFGSFARGHGGEESDVEVLILMPAGTDLHAHAWQRQLRVLERSVLGWTGNRLEALVLSEQDLGDAAIARERIIGELSDDAVTLLGPEVAELIRHTRRLITPPASSRRVSRTPPGHGHAIASPRPTSTSPTSSQPRTERPSTSAAACACSPASTRVTRYA